MSSYLPDNDNNKSDEQGNNKHSKNNVENEKLCKEYKTDDAEEKNYV